jgi:hypothetical protein
MADEETRRAGKNNARGLFIFRRRAPVIGVPAFCPAERRATGLMIPWLYFCLDRLNNSAELGTTVRVTEDAQGSRARRL